MKVAFTLLLLLCATVSADSRIETITLQHRLAADVLPQLRAFMPDDAIIEAYRDTLIIRAEPDTLAEVHSLLQTLDQPPQSLTVTVRRSSQRLDTLDGADDRLRIEAGDDIGASAQIRRWSTRDARERDQQFEARTIAGHAVSIQMGQDVPRREYLVFSGHRGAGVQIRDYYLSVDSGFRATPVLLPDGLVRVEIYPRFSEVSPARGQIDHSELITTVVGRLGQWLEIARVSENATQRQDGANRYHSRLGNEEILYLRVDLFSNQ